MWEEESGEQEPLHPTTTALRLILGWHFDARALSRRSSPPPALRLLASVRRVGGRRSQPTHLAQFCPLNLTSGGSAQTAALARLARHFSAEAIKFFQLPHRCRGFGCERVPSFAWQRQRCKFAIDRFLSASEHALLKATASCAGEHRKVSAFLQAPGPYLARRPLFDQPWALHNFIFGEGPFWTTAFSRVSAFKILAYNYGGHPL